MADFPHLRWRVALGCLPGFSAGSALRVFLVEFHTSSSCTLPIIEKKEMKIPKPGYVRLNPSALSFCIYMSNFWLISTGIQQINKTGVWRLNMCREPPNGSPCERPCETCKRVPSSCQLTLPEHVKVTYASSAAVPFLSPCVSFWQSPAELQASCVWLVLLLLLFSPVGWVLHSLSISWASHIRRTSGVRHPEWSPWGTTHFPHILPISICLPSSSLLSLLISLLPLLLVFFLLPPFISLLFSTCPLLFFL